MTPGDGVEAPGSLLVAWSELELGNAALRAGPGTSLTLLNLDDRIAQFQMGDGTIIVRLRSLAPDEIVVKLNGEIGAVLGEPATKARFAELGGSPMIGSSADYKAFLTAETDKWAKVVKAAGLKPG